jgi:hypothetical protein
MLSLATLGLSFLVAAQVKARVHFVPPQTLVFAGSPVSVLHLPPLAMFWSSPEELQEQAGRLFASSDSLGTIALGAAEGTRTHDGQKTVLWYHHTDPGNGALNKGTFAWQLGAANAEEADAKGLARIQQEAIPSLLQAAQQQQVGMDIETLIQGADLWNQSPDAGAGFVQNFKQCLAQNLPNGEDTLLCARLASFYHPETGELEAGGFGGDLERLEEDQKRRIQVIQRVLQANQDNLLKHLR